MYYELSNPIYSIVIVFPAASKRVTGKVAVDGNPSRKSMWCHRVGTPLEVFPCLFVRDYLVFLSRQIKPTRPNLPAFAELLTTYAACSPQTP
jgi:hypothetical protein